MYNKIKSFFEGKRVVILGYGREGISTLKLISDMGCKSITIADKNEDVKNQIENAERYSFCLGEDYLSCLDDCDIIMKAPGIGLKNSVSEEIKEKITSQTDIFLQTCECKIIGITGTKGKSTTSSLIYHILKESGYDTMLIGNIGVPPLERMSEFKKDTVIVCEMSCHQLEYVKASPDVSVLLNIYPEHLDHYESFEAYADAKLNIFRYQTEKDTLIIGYEVKEKADTKAEITVAGFGCGDIGTRDNGIFINGEFISADRIDTRLKGEHNLYNIAIAFYAAMKVGCTIEDCLKALPSFKGLAHRLEFVGTVNGAEYINDSISTAPQTAIAALKAYPDTDTLIIGGMDRGISYDELAEFLNGKTSVRNLIILPDSGKRAAKDVTNPDIEKLYADDMQMAVEIAKQVTRVRCILSPAAASYGFYKNFEERGSHFKALLGF